MIHSIKIHSGNYINIDDNLKLYYNSENMFDIEICKFIFIIIFFSDLSINLFCIILSICA